MHRSSSSSPATGSAVTLVLGVAMIAAVAGFWVFTRTPGGQVRVRGAAVSRGWEPTCTGPRPDTTLPEAGRGPEAVRALQPGRRGYLLVQIGACARCLVPELTAWKRVAAAKGYRLVLVTHAKTPPQDNYADEPALRTLPLVRDKSGELTRYFNSCFTPRAYAFKPNWLLLGFQADGEFSLQNPFADPGLAGAR